MFTSCIASRFVVLLLCLGASPTTGEEKAVIQFNVKPTGQMQHEVVKLRQELGCVFSYTAFGGTQEQWRMVISEQEDSYSCTIERQEGISYIMFQHFAASITKQILTSVEVFSNSGALLQDEDFTVDGGTVKKGEGFQSNLVAVHLRAAKKS